MEQGDVMRTKTPHFTGNSHHQGQTFGPFSFLNPTSRRYALPPRKSAQDASKQDLGKNDEVDRPAPEDEIGAEDVQREWRSRDNRKDAIAVTPQASGSKKFFTPPYTNTLKQTLKGIWRMFSTYPYWDVSYLVAVSFVWGSLVWCINAFFVWLPLQVPSSEFNNEITSGGGITAFIGATIFEFGSILLMIEAVNENRADCFGWALEEVLKEAGVTRLRPSGCTHHHQNEGNLVGKGNHLKTVGKVLKDQPVSSSPRTWAWFPTWYELKTHYFKEIGFLACLSQMVGATIFWIAGFTALPPIYDRLTSTAAQNGAYWLPQVVGGTGFIVSGTLFMLETQKKWYLPAPKVLGWHIGLWNLIGGIGFTLCGALGFASSNSGCVYQGSLATFWGSWCFLIGSIIQWYEGLEKNPVEIDEGGGRVS